MPKVKPLNDRQIKSAKPKDKQYKLADGDGLYLLIKPTGAKVWSQRYVIDGRSSQKSLGQYPEVSLVEARRKREELRAEVAKGIKPITKKEEVQKTTFKDLVEEYFEFRTDLSDGYIKDNRGYLKNHYYPTMEDMALEDIEPSHIISCIQMIEKKGKATLSKKTSSLLDRIFRYGATKQYIQHNPMGVIDTKVLIKPHKVKNYAHITDEETLKHLLHEIEDYSGDISTKTALRLMPYVFVRPANIRFMLWDEIDFNKKLWTIPDSKMKIGRDHTVPLTDSMIEIINTTKGNGSEYVFPSPQTTKRPLSENTLNVGLKRLGYKDTMTSHGFRHTASTFLHENMEIHGVHSDAIEMQMAHTVGNTVKGVYNKAQYIKERIRLMEWWSAYLDALKDSQ